MLDLLVVVGLLGWLDCCDGWLFVYVGFGWVG